MAMAKKILIVDDDKDLVQTLEAALRHNGYEVAKAYSGTEGLAALVKEKPDLIILDVMMETDTAGFEIADQIRNSRSSSRYAEFKSIPIVMLTAINQVTNSRFSLGDKDSFLPDIKDFLTKPIKIDELLKIIAQYFK